MRFVTFLHGVYDNCFLYRRDMGSSASALNVTFVTFGRPGAAITFRSATHSPLLFFTGTVHSLVGMPVFAEMSRMIATGSRGTAAIRRRRSAEDGLMYISSVYTEAMKLTSLHAPVRASVHLPQLFIGLFAGHVMLAQSAAWNKFAIGGVTMQQKMGAWWNAPMTDPSAKHVTVPCQYKTATKPHKCNPTC